MVLSSASMALTKTFKGKAAVKNLDMKVREGAIYGFIGRNGAGKSTTLKMVCGLAAPTSGDIRIYGKAVPDFLLYPYFLKSPFLSSMMISF